MFAQVAAGVKQSPGHDAVTGCLLLRHRMDDYAGNVGSASLWT